MIFGLLPTGNSQSLSVSCIFFSDLLPRFFLVVGLGIPSSSTSMTTGMVFLGAVRGVIRALTALSCGTTLDFKFFSSVVCEILNGQL